MKKRAERQSELRKQLKRKKRRRIIVRLIGLLIILGVIGFILVSFIHALNTAVFDLKKIEVIGNETVDSQTVITSSQAPIGSNIFLVNINTMETNINACMKSESLMITKKLPDTIIIHINQQRPLFAIVSGNETYYLSQNQEVVEKSDHLGKTNVPLVSGLSANEHPKVGSKLELQPDLKVEDIKKMLNALENSGYTSRISEIVASSSNNYKIITKNNVAIQIDDYKAFETNYDYIGTVIQKNQSNLNITVMDEHDPIIKSR